MDFLSPACKILNSVERKYLVILQIFYLILNLYCVNGKSENKRKGFKNLEYIVMETITLTKSKSYPNLFVYHKKISK